MIRVARIVRARPQTVARTLRGFGVGLSDLGDALNWGEALLLLDSASADPSTHLGAELAGWAYPASMRELFMLAATVRDTAAARRLMPWSPELKPRDDAPTTDEVEAAQAELEDGIVFSS